ncbi:Turripeptide VIII-01, partial [Bienertia sinuspersici]
KIFHGGTFKKGKNGVWVYTGGLCRTFEVDPDELCWFYLKELVEKCGVSNDGLKIYYLMLGIDFVSGLRSVYDDNEVRRTGEVLMKSRCIDLYVVGDGKELDFLTSNQPSQTEYNVVNAQPISGPIDKQIDAIRPQKLTPRRSARLTQESCEVAEKMPQLSQKTAPAMVPTPTTTIKNKKQKAISKSCIEPNPIFSNSLSLQNTTLTEIHQTELIHTSEDNFVRYKVPDEYEWEENRPNSPISLSQLLYDADNSEDEWGSDPDYEVPDDLGSNENEEEDWLVDYQVDDDISGLDGEPDGEHVEEQDLDQLREVEVLDGLDTSDDEQRVARDRVKGFNFGVIELAHKLQVEAAEGKLSAQRVEESDLALRNEGNIVSDYEESEEEIHTPTPSDEDETLEERRAKRGLLVGKDTDFSKFQWQVGQRFTSRVEFKQAVTKFAIFQGRNLCVVAANKKRQQRIGVRCSEGCPFWLYASWDSRRGSFVVKGVMNEHTCLRNMEKNIQLKSTWLAEQLLDVFKARPHWPAKEIIETIRRAYRVIVKKDFVYKVKYYAHRKLHGSMRDHYGKVGRYLQALKKACPATDVDLVTYKHNNKGPLVFQRLYVCFDGVRKGWNGGCRNIICIDACFFKTFLGGQLM